MKKITGIVLLVIIAGVLLMYTTPLKQYEPHRVFEYFGVFNNKLEVVLNTSSENCKSLKVYWIGEKQYLTEEDKILKNYLDTLLIYSDGEILKQIPDRYGKNGLIVKYCDVIVDDIGFYKFKNWYKHTYSLYINEKDKHLRINWKIENQYESKAGIAKTL